MSGASIIKEFLVGLGFKIDNAGFKKFELGLKQATKVATQMGAAATGAAASVEAAVVKISSSFEDLYWASQRMHSSVENIKATDYAITQMGGSAQGARAAMEGIAEFMRSNPGGERFIAGLGVATRDANGEMRDTADIMKDLGARFRNMPYFAAKVRANMLGIDEKTLQAMIRGTDEFSDRYHAMAARMGVDQDAAAKASHDFMVQVRDLKVQLELMLAKILMSLQGPGMKAMQNFAETGIRVLEALGIIVLRLITWLGQLDDVTGGWASTALALLAVLGPILMVLDPIVVGVIALGVAITALIDDFNTWREGGKSLIDWSAWSAEIDKVMAALKPLFAALADLGGALADIGEALVKWLGPYVANIAHGALESIAGGLHLITNLIRLITALLRGDWKQAWEVAKQGASQWADDVKSVWDKLTGGRSAPGKPNAPPAQAGGAAPGAAAPPPPKGQQAALGQQAMAFFQSKGWSREQAAGIVANLAKESGFNARAVGDNGKAYGLGQWHPDRQAAFAKWAGKDIRASTFAEQLAFVQHELTQGMERRAGNMLKAARTAAQAGATVARYYERPANVDAEAAVRGRMAENWYARPNVAQNGGTGAQVQIQQKTDVHVHGVNDPQAAGRAAANEQGRVNGDLLRNTKSALG